MSNVKPHQFDKDKKTYVECTSEQREEILRIAKEYGRKVYYETPNSGSEYRNLVWGNNDEYIWGTRATFNNDPKLNWLPYSEFVARLKGEWTPEVKPEVKPHQFDKSRDTCVKCTPEQRAEIIRIARELGRGIYDDNNIENEINEYPNLYWSCNSRELDGLSANGGSPRDRFVSYEEFVARLKGEWVEKEPQPDTIQVPQEGLITAVTINGTKIPIDPPVKVGSTMGQLVVDLKRVEPNEPREVKIPFDASRMHEAIRFETRYGKEVRSVCVNKLEVDYPVTGFKSGSHYATSWMIDGSLIKGRIHSDSDLFMIVKEGVK